MASTPFIDPRNPGNITTPLPCEANWSKTFLPPVLGRLDHSPDFFKMKTKTHLRDPTTKKLVRDPEGNPIKDFTNIPPCISTNVEPWRIEAYFRLHGDFSYHNLWARQPIWQPKPNNAAKNKVNNLRARRVRVPLNMRAWNTKYAGRPPKTLVETVEILDQNQIDQNTTWDVTPKGIVQPGNPNHILPLGYFLENNVPHTPSKEVTAALELSQKLKAKAEAQGKNHWSELPSNDLPPGWIARISRSRAKVEISGDVKSEGDSEDKSEEGPEEEPHGKNVLSQARLNHMKMKFETSDESREESGQEPDDEPKEEPLRKQAVRGSRTVNMKRNVDPSDESSEEADAGGDEVEWVPQMNRRSKNSKVSSESSRGDRMKGSPAVGVSQRNEGKKRLGRPVNMDENYKPKSVSSGVVLKTSKTRCDEPSDKSSPAKSSPAKAKKRKLEHTNNGLPDPESPRIMAAIDPADAPDITPNAPRTPSSQTAPTIHTAETLRAMANGQPVSDQMIHEMLEAQAQNMLSEATLAFVFSGFVPFPSSPTSQHPSDPFQAEEPTLFPQHTWPTNSTTSHIPSPFSTIQPTMASLLADRAAMPPPLLPGRILSPPPPIDQLTERAEHWANQKAFIEGEQARMREPTSNPNPTIDEAWYGAYDQQWYHPKPELSEAEQVSLPSFLYLSSPFHPSKSAFTNATDPQKKRQVENGADGWYHERSCQLIIEELREAAKDKGADFYNEIAMGMLMSGVTSKVFAQQYYTASMEKVEELAAEERQKANVEDYPLPSTWFETSYYPTEGGFGADFL